MRIYAAFFIQVFGRTLLGYNAVRQHDYFVGTCYRSHSVRYNKHSFVLNKSRKRSLYRSFVFDIQTCHCLAQKTDRRSFTWQN